MINWLSVSLLLLICWNLRLSWPVLVYISLQHKRLYNEWSRESSIYFPASIIPLAKSLTMIDNSFEASSVKVAGPGYIYQSFSFNFVNINSWKQYFYRFQREIRQHSSERPGIILCTRRSSIALRTLKHNVMICFFTFYLY
jgi:hypothetical protein